MILKTEALVLKTMDFRETSRIATFYTRDYGKLSGVLKGIRRDPRKFGSSVEKFSLNEIVFYQYRSADLHLISQCDMRQDFYPIRQDLKKIMAASYMAELIEKILPSEEPNQELFDVLLDFLNSLAEARDIDFLIYMLQIKVLSLSGFRPHLDVCLKCGQPITSGARFGLEAGGLICSRCPLIEGKPQPITPGTIATLLYIEKHTRSLC